MSRIAWDQSGARKYENGVDRGVLYLPDGSGVAWNGLTAVDEDSGGLEVNPYYFEGVKYLDTRSIPDFSANMKAITYPDEFLQFDGIEEVDDRMFLTGQAVSNWFGLSYRTMIGNDIDGSNFGYKIHVLYNLTAAPDNKSYVTLGNQDAPTEFSWTITGVPEQVPGHRPTAHLIIDSTKINKYLLRDIENLLYGADAVYSDPVAGALDGGVPLSAGTGNTDGNPGTGSVDGGTPFTAPIVASEVQPESAPRLPALAELVSMISEWSLITITDNGDGTWTAEGPDEFITMTDSTTFLITQANATYTDPDTYTITDTHSF